MIRESDGSRPAGKGLRTAPRMATAAASCSGADQDSQQWSLTRWSYTPGGRSSAEVSPVTPRGSRHRLRFHLRFAAHSAPDNRVRLDRFRRLVHIKIICINR